MIALVSLVSEAGDSQLCRYFMASEKAECGKWPQPDLIARTTAATNIYHCRNVFVCGH